MIGRLGAERHETAVHEYMHLLLRASGGQFPPWLNEGLAEVYSTLEPVAKQVRIGAPPLGRLQALQRLSWIPVERLLQVRQGDPEYSSKQHAASYARAGRSPTC